MSTTCVVRSGLRREAGHTSPRLAGQVAAVRLLTTIMTEGRDADAPGLFFDALEDVLDLAADGDLDEAREQLQGLSRILGPAVRDGLLARRRTPLLRDVGSTPA